MLEKILDIIKEQYNLESIDAKEFSSFKAKGMKFTIDSYYAKGLGHISVMKAVGFFGLMKMDTLIIVPIEKDLPLYSYDRIYAMGNDTLIVELYDTMINKTDVSQLASIKAKYNHLTERDPGEHWYDYMKLAESISKICKKKNSNEFDLLTLEHLKAYLNICNEKIIDNEKKIELSSKYVNGLLDNGGPSTDVFIKMFGREKTEKLYNEILFGLKRY
jgi:hypothetical protein